MIKKLAYKIQDLSDYSMGLLLFLSSLTLRIIYAVYAYSINVMESFADDKGYFYLAKEIVNRGKIFYDKDIHLYAELVGPGLPWINSFAIFLFGGNWIPIFIVSSLFSALITLFIYKVALAIFGKPTALLAGLWSCFYFFYLDFSATSGKDIIMAFFLIVVVWLLIYLFHLKKFSWFNFLLLVIVYTYSFHFDERFLIFSPFILLYILYHETESFKKLQVKRSFLFFILVVMLTIPWTIRNYREFEKIVLVSTRLEPYTDKIFGYERKENTMDKYNDVNGYFFIHNYQVDSIIAGLKTRTDGGYIISEKQRQAMEKGHLPGPLKGVKAFWIRVKDMLWPFQIWGEYQRTGYFYYEKSLRHNLVSFLFYGTMFFLSFPGFYLLFRKNKRVFYLFISIIVIYTLLHGLLIPYTNWRYRLPLDSIFIMVGSYGFIQLLNYYLQLNKNRISKNI